jgi:fumarylacetoacetase
VPTLDRSHDASLKSWVASTQRSTDFPIQNLPFGVFSPEGGEPRGGVAIGDAIFDLKAALATGLFEGEALAAAQAGSGPVLNPLMGLPASARRGLRLRLVELLEDGSAERARVEPLLHTAADCRMHTPAAIGDYTDFYAGIHHATAVGKLFRPDNSLLPNYKHVPIGYHGRASSVRVSGEAVRRPNGQRKRPDEAAPSFGPCRNLDYELELGVWVAGANPLGRPISIADAADHIFGVSLLNDWSARDIQTWEYQPLGPFLAKSFATTLSPWIVTAEALAPFRRPQAARPDGDPAPLPYLLDATDQAEGALDIALEVLISIDGGAPERLSTSNATDLYWTFAQFVAHHTSGGCNLNPGDLLGSGTISGPSIENGGSLLELTHGGQAPLQLESGARRGFLQDGDEVILRGRCEREGSAAIGFGDCRAAILPALNP